MQSHLARACRHIIVELNGRSLESLRPAITALAPLVHAISVGPELQAVEGTPRIIQAIGDAGGKVMLDVQLNCAPSVTMRSAQAYAAHSALSLFTVNTSCGEESLASALKHCGKKQVVGVLVPQHLKQTELRRQTGKEPLAAMLDLTRTFLRHGGNILICPTQVLGQLQLEASKFASVRHGEAVRFIAADPLCAAMPKDDVWSEFQRLSVREAVRRGADYLFFKSTHLHGDGSDGQSMERVKAVAQEITTAFLDCGRWNDQLPLQD